MTTFNILLSFLLVTVFGNILLSSWQHTTWIRQRRFESRANSISALQELFDKLVRITSKRRYAMLRVLYAINSKDNQRIEVAQEQYVTILHEWNTYFNEISIKLVFNLDAQTMFDFEERINNEFVSIGRDLDSALKLKSETNENRLNTLEKRLNDLNYQIFSINRDIYRKLNKIKQNEIFIDDRKIDPSRYLEASSWGLFRNLFKPRT